MGLLDNVTGAGIAHMRPPRLLTLLLKRSTPLKPAKGSANRQSSAYATMSPAPPQTISVYHMTAVSFA